MQFSALLTQKVEIVADKYEAILRDLMEEYFCELFGFIPKITAKGHLVFC